MPRLTQFFIEVNKSEPYSVIKKRLIYSFLVFVCLNMVITCGVVNADAMTREEITERLGSDYYGFWPDPDNVSTCEDACLANSNCLAFTYDKPAYRLEKPNNLNFWDNFVKPWDKLKVIYQRGVCHLKQALPSPRLNYSCTSGVRMFSPYIQEILPIEDVKHHGITVLKRTKIDKSSKMTINGQHFGTFTGTGANPDIQIIYAKYQENPGKQPLSSDLLTIEYPCCPYSDTKIETYPPQNIGTQVLLIYLKKGNLYSNPYEAFYVKTN